MAAYAVLRIQKLKSWGDIAGADAHNFRERETPNADAERTQGNATFIGKAEQDSVEAIKAAIGEQKIRKNAVLAVEMLMNASPWQRGTNENTNGLLRQYFPKDFGMAGYAQEQLDEIAAKLNSRPRKVLNFRTPAEVFSDALQ